MPYRGLDAQNLTIGYGHVIRPDDPRRERWMTHGITHEEALEVKRDDMQRYTNFVNNFLTSNSISLNQHQHDALVSFTFNAGPDWITMSPASGLRTAIMSGYYGRIGDEMMRWVYVTVWEDGRWVNRPSVGLYRRRTDEVNMFYNTEDAYSRTYPYAPDEYI